MSLTVILDNGKRVIVRDRVAEMIAFVLARSERIQRAEAVKVEHNCSGKRVQSKVGFFETESTLCGNQG